MCDKHELACSVILFQNVKKKFDGEKMKPKMQFLEQNITQLIAMQNGVENISKNEKQKNKKKI